jgi:DNA-binding response OmpR family regulator
MDVHMPEMDGLHATRLIRAAEAQRHTHVPIIAVTADAMKGDRERCLAAGMDGYVSKPYQAEELTAAIHAAIHTTTDSATIEVDDTPAKRHDHATTLDLFPDDPHFRQSPSRPDDDVAAGS